LDDFGGFAAKIIQKIEVWGAAPTTLHQPYPNPQG
jgi:hypothetical protein